MTEPRLKQKKIGRSTDGGGSGLKFFKIILLQRLYSRSIKYLLALEDGQKSTTASGGRSITDVR